MPRAKMIANNAHKRHVKEQYDKSIKSRVSSERDLVLVYNQASDTPGARKFISMWHRPYIIKHLLGKEAYELVDYDGNTLKDPINGIYLNRY